ncbi:MAG TPA: hypothetical protein VIL99_12205 [Ignavibacteria bacterium]
MRKISFTIAVTIIILAGSLFTGCWSSDQKKDAAKAEVVAAQENLNKVQKNADIVAEKAATADELKTFKLESELKIKNNEVRIAELKLKINKSGSGLDEVYAKRIDSLELKNKNLKTRMGDYEKTHSEWSKFKHDFNRDLDELGNKLKNCSRERQ